MIWLHAEIISDFRKALTNMLPCITIYYMGIQRQIINISVPRAIAKQIEAQAKKENKTKSELMREAFRMYQFRQDWEKIRMWGKETAKRFKIKTYDDIERIAG